MTLSWDAGPARLGAQPHHYEVEIPDKSNPGILLYPRTNVPGTTLTIDDAGARGLEGTHTAEVRHCNAASGCSDELSIEFTLDPEVVLSPPTGLTLRIEPDIDPRATSDLDLTFTHSTGSTHNYQFALERSDNRYGFYSAAGSPVNDSSSPADFDDKDQGYWYRAHGRNCATSDRTECGDWSDWSDSIWVPDPAWTTFAFTPSPLALGGTSNVWTVPSRANGVYVDVDFAVESAKNPGGGKIHIEVLGANDVVHSTREIVAENDGGGLELPDAPATSRVRVTVDNDAFDLQYSLVTLTFHSGIDATGLALARATAQKERQPTAPVSGNWSADSAAGSVMLSWEAGPARLGAQPHHYEVEIPDASNPGTLLYTNRNVPGTSLVIDNLMTRGLEGTHTAEVRHCNAAGGCSAKLSIAYTTTNPEDYAVSRFTMNDDGLVTWNPPREMPGGYRLLHTIGTNSGAPITLPADAESYQFLHARRGYRYLLEIQTKNRQGIVVPLSNRYTDWYLPFTERPTESGPAGCEGAGRRAGNELTGNTSSYYEHTVYPEVWSQQQPSLLGIISPLFVGPEYNYCVFGRIRVESTPGASRIDVMGELHTGSYSTPGEVGPPPGEGAEGLFRWRGDCSNCQGGYWDSEVTEVKTSLEYPPYFYAEVATTNIAVHGVEEPWIPPRVISDAYDTVQHVVFSQTYEVDLD